MTFDVPEKRQAEFNLLMIAHGFKAKEAKKVESEQKYEVFCSNMRYLVSADRVAESQYGYCLFLNGELVAALPADAIIVRAENLLSIGNPDGF